MVYKGRRKKTIHYYTIKSVEKVLKPRVLREVRTMHALQHPNVLHFHQWYETTNHLWLILEYCVGGDLLSLIRQDIRLPEASVHDFGRDLVSALLFLHSQGVLYCDLKPSNILLDENGKIKLGDFGLARRLGRSGDPAGGSGGGKRGTPCYMAPELFQEAGCHSMASDLWALGCVLYECAAGHPPFVSSSFTSLVRSILEDDPKPLPNASPELHALLSGLLEKNPCRRLGWGELVQLPFWKVPPGELPEFPPNRDFDAFVREAGYLGGGGGGGGDGADGEGQGRGRREDLGGSPAVDRRDGGVVAAGQSEPGASGTAGAMGADAYVASTHSEGAATASPTRPGGRGPPGRQGSVDVLRLSQVVRENLEREEGGAEYRSSLNVDNSDIQLDNPDAELDFSTAPQPGVGGEEAQDVETAPCPEAPDTPGGTAPNRGGGGGAGEPTGGAVLSGESPPPGLADAHHAGAAEQVRPGEEGLEVPRPAGGPPGSAEGTLSEEQASPSGSETGGRGPTDAGDAASPGGRAAPPGRDGVEAADAELGSGALDPLGNVFHASDLSVRPIVGNRRIEKIMDPRYDRQGLPFTPLTLQHMLSSSQPELEAFLTKVYRSVSGQTPISEKVNTLTYFETLCSDTASANILVNSSLMVLFVSKLKSAKMSSLRVRLASVIGLLIRHATFITDDLAATGVVDVLADTLKDKTVQVRRRSVSSLGELLFYIATQMQDRKESGRGPDDGDAAWSISSNCVTHFSRMLKGTEDEVVQHYAVKTLENMASHDGEWAHRFCNGEVVAHLLRIATSSRSENLKATAASTLARMMRWRPELVQPLVDNHGVALLVAGVNHGNSKVVQPFITMLVVALKHASPRTKKSVADEKGLVLKMLKIMEHGHTVLKGKAVLCLALLFEVHPPWLMTACNHKFVSLVDKLSKEKDDFLRNSLAEMVSTTRRLLPKLIASMQAEVEKIQSRKYCKPGSASGSRAALGLQGALGCFPALLHLLTSAVMRSSVVSERMLQMVSLFLVTVEPLSFPGQRELWQCVLNVLEALSQQYDTLLHYSEEVVGRLLPAVSQLMTSGKSGDTRFLCARLFCDMVLFYLSNAAPERPHGRPARPCVGTEFLREKVLAFLPKLLSDEDPIPLYALKLGKAALDQDSSLMEDVVRMGLVPEFFSYLSLEHSNNNVHNMWICKAAIASPLVPLELLVEGGAGARIVAILKYAYDNNVETFLEPALDLCAALLEREKSEPEKETLDLGDLKNAAHIIHVLQSDEDASVGTAASVCVGLLMDCFDGLVPGVNAA